MSRPAVTGPGAAAGERMAVDAADGWDLAVTAAMLLAIDPAGLGGAVLRGLPGVVRDRWLAIFAHFLPPGAAVRSVPGHIDDGRLLGGLDLSATLRAGKPVRERGLLAAADGGWLVLAMAERLPAARAGLIAAALDSGQMRLERDGFAVSEASRFGVIALDESMDEEERPTLALRDRLAFDLDLRILSHRDLTEADTPIEAVPSARRNLPDVHMDDALIAAMTGTAMALGIGSLRVPLLAVRTACAAAALAGRRGVEADDAALAVRLVLGHRATHLPAEPEEEEPEAPSSDQPSPPENDDQNQEPGDRPLEDRLLEAALAALPPDLLNSLRHRKNKTGPQSEGNAGAIRKAGRRGRPVGVRAGKPGRGYRLSVIETLRAAAPWQPLRRTHRSHPSSARMDVRPDDFRVQRRKERSQTTVIFVVDASGSSAFERLAEAKGAVELLLAECYSRRDQVALLVFRGREAELLLPPTRSLVRAKRCLASLPGGGGTPLASGVQAAAELADAARRQGETPLLVFLTDGRANIALDGTPERKQALEEALRMAKRVSAFIGEAALVIDISTRPGTEAVALAEALGGRYLALPRADARTVSASVTAAMRP